jgi:hypothetical protein
MSQNVFHIGKSESGANVYLTREDLRTSVHIMGLSQRGKSNLTYYLCKQMIEQEKAFFLLDPHASVYDKLLRFLVATDYKRKILLFNPSYSKRIVGFNPWLTEYSDPARISTKAQQMANGTLKVWGAENTYHYVNIQKWLKNLYYVLLEQRLTLSDLDFFIYWGDDRVRQRRDAIIRAIQYPAVRYELSDLYARGRKAFEDIIKTASTQLDFFRAPHVRRIMGMLENNLDFSRIREKKQIVLGNFQPASDYLIGLSELRVIGTLLISEIWETVCRSNKRIEYYFIIDEFANYVTQDIPHLLEEAAKRDIHLILIHQQAEQIRGISGAMQSAQTKITFSLEDNPKKVGWCELRRFNHERIEVKTPEMPDYHITQRQTESYANKLIKRFPTMEEVDTLQSMPHNESVPIEPEYNPDE